MRSVIQEIEAGKFQVLLTSPEMCLRHPGFRKLCISQWGGDFRTAYAELEKLRAFVPVGIPIHAVSATLPPAVLAEVNSALTLQSMSGKSIVVVTPLLLIPSSRVTFRPVLLRGTPKETSSASQAHGGLLPRGAQYAREKEGPQSFSARGDQNRIIGHGYL